MTSADSAHSAWESSELNGGVFTYYFVQALHDPAADTNGDGWVSAEEASHYAAGRTNEYTLAIPGGDVQNPQMHDSVPGELLLTKPAGEPAASSVMPFTIADDGEQPGKVYYAGPLLRLPTQVNELN
jgi:hypothetical protein